MSDVNVSEIEVTHSRRHRLVGGDASRNAATGEGDPAGLASDRVCAGARLVARAEGILISEARVLELMLAHAGSNLSKDPLFFPFFLALFVVQRFDLASRMLKEGSQLDCDIEIRVGAPSPGFECVTTGEIVSQMPRSGFRRFLTKRILCRDDTRNIILSFYRLFPLFADYIQRGAEATGAVDVSLWDTGLVPGLAFCSNKPDQYLIPDNLFISSRGVASSCIRAYRENDVPWEQRRAVAFWRGATTGQPLGTGRSAGGLCPGSGCANWVNNMAI